MGRKVEAWQEQTPDFLGPGGSTGERPRLVTANLLTQPHLEWGRFQAWPEGGAWWPPCLVKEK